MADVVVYSGGVPVHLSGVAAVSDLAWSTGWGGGCLNASWTMDLPPDRSYPYLTTGRDVAIFDGPQRVWWGRLSEPVRGSPWEVHARGMGTYATRYLALDSAGNPTTSAQTAVAEAILRGFPVTGGVSGGSLAAKDVRPNRLSDLLDAEAQESGQRWGVFADGVIVMRADPTTPTWHLHMTDAASGTADDDYVTHVYARYVSAVDANGNPTTYATASVGDTAAVDRWGRSEHPLDLTSLGLMTAGTASGHAQGVLNQGRARLGFTDAFEVTPDVLTSVGGIGARLSLVQAGDMVRIFGVTDAQGMLEFRGYRDVVIGETQYQDGSGRLTLKPVGLAPRTLVDAIAAEPEREFVA